MPKLLKLPLAFAIGLPAGALTALIRIYQKVVSPILPMISPQCGCRFAPTCSHYALEAIRRHGAVAGACLALCRLLKCTPLHKGGFDPVPDRLFPAHRPLSSRQPALHCTRVST